jgi:NAD(P)H-hydrate epimerase
MRRLTRKQVREVDHLAIVEYHVSGIVLMENAARGAAEVVLRRLAGVARPVVGIVAGPGNNGGDGLAMARHLHNHGVAVQLFHPADVNRLSPDAAANYRIVGRMPIAKIPASADAIRGFDGDLLIDALFGTGLTEPPRADAAALIDAMNYCDADVFAVDLPSGLDADTGEPLGLAVRAAATATFVAEKLGFANPRSRDHTGEITVIDIGCPREIIDRVAAERG